MTSGLLPVWKRDSASQGRKVHVRAMCFAEASLRDDVKLQVDLFGVSSVASFRAVQVREHLRADNPDWFDGWRSSGCRVLAASDLGEDLATLDRADRAYSFDFEGPEPGDLAYLQSVWAMTRWFFARGATVALDVFSVRYRLPRDVPAVDAPFDVRNEVRVLVEALPDDPSACIVNTRGLVKLARPDLVAVCRRDEGDAISDLLWQVAEGMAHGFLPQLPRHGIDVAEDESWYLVDPGADPVVASLALHNDARMLVTEDGAPLHRRARR